MKLDRLSTRQVIVLVLVAGILVVAGWVVVAVVGRARTEANGLRVYCLAPERHEGLVNAAEALGLAERGNTANRVDVGGEEYTPGEWRERRPDDFDDACEALSAAQRPPSGGVFATLLPFLTALVGAVGAFLATSWRDRVVRAQVLADDLRAATGAFSRAVDDYLADIRVAPSETELAAQRVALLTQVSRARAARPGWEEIGRVEAALTSGPLGPEISAKWRRGVDGEAANDARRDELRVRLAATRDELFGLADRIERPSRRKAWQLAATGGGRP